MTNEIFEKYMRLMVGFWPQRSPSQDTIAAYWIALSHLDDSTFAYAIERCIRECRFFPLPAEIIERAEEGLTEAGLLPPTIDEGWDMVMRAIRSRDPIPDPTVEETVRMLGGLRQIGMTEIENLGYVRRDFAATYGMLRKRKVISDSRLMAQALPSGGSRPMIDEGEG